MSNLYLLFISLAISLVFSSWIGLAQPSTGISNVEPIMRKVSLGAKPLIVNFLSVDGEFDCISYVQARHEYNTRERIVSEAEPFMDYAMDGQPKKRSRRNYAGYDPELSRQSSWFRNYVQGIELLYFYSWLYFTSTDDSLFGFWYVI